MASSHFAHQTNKQEQLEHLFHSLYPYDNDNHFNRLLQIMAAAASDRSDTLKAADQGDSNWYMSNHLVGMMLYTDLFAGDLARVIEKIPYFKELGITYIHFMPLLKARDGENDGGYAVADYREIDPRFGTMDQFRDLVARLRAEGIHVCLDYVVNHTAKDHDWALRALAGEKEYQDLYFMYDTDDVPRKFEETVPEV
ncbi:MAG: alpha-amylase, partial [Clostridia bacterium]|nr:alpha-amylase [Clostridia bacterium]